MPAFFFFIFIAPLEYLENNDIRLICYFHVAYQVNDYGFYSSKNISLDRSHDEPPFIYSKFV